MKTKRVKGADGKSHLELVDGSCSVKIYSGKQRKGGTTYPIQYVTYFEGGKRVRKAFSDAAEAKTHAGTILTRLVNGETSAKDLRPVELQEAAMAIAELAPLKINLLTAIREYRHACEQLKGKGSLNDAVGYFMTNASPDLPKKTVPEVCAELVAAKKKDRLSQAYLDDLQQRVKKFGESFTGQIAEITTADIEQWLRGLGTGAKNRNNYAGAVTTLFKFAKRSGYLAKDRDTAADDLTRAKYTGGDIEIYTPTELTTILNRLRQFREDLLPFVAIGAFAGIRSAEIMRLTWDNVDFSHNQIQISAKNAKTSQRRYVPIQPNLSAWLKPYKEKKGAICAIKRIQYTVGKFIEKPLKESNGKETPGIKWKPNALRHSYGSYRLPIIKSAAELALEMGNSPAMIFRHYRELVKPKDAEAYWAIMPPDRQ